MHASWLISRVLSSIIAVHGLNGNPTTTWKHSATNHFWLQDSLPLDIERARVLNYGYNADVVFGNSTADVWDHAKSLLGSLIDEREIEEVSYSAIYHLNIHHQSLHVARCVTGTKSLDHVGIETTHYLHCALIRRYHSQTGSCLGAQGATIPSNQGPHPGNRVLWHTTPRKRQGQLRKDSGQCRYRGHAQT